MKKRNKKGFTLIELLAVIVILAIIALIATPIVMNLISKARKSAAEDSAYGMVKAAENYYAETLLETSGNGISSDLEFSCTKDGCKTDKDKKLTFNGTKPSSGTITIKLDGKVDIKDLVINNYKCNYKENSTEIECLSSGQTTTTTTTTQAKEILADNITISEIDMDVLDKGVTTTLTATISPSDTSDKTITWTSSDENVATVNKNGEVTTINSGITTITARTSNGKYATKQINVYRDFNTDSWETIIDNANENNYFLYKVGDTKTVDMGSFGTHTVRVSNTTPCDGSLQSETACGFVIEFADIIKNYKMDNLAANLGGWPSTKMRTYLNNDIYNALPSELKNGIINTTVISGHTFNISTNFNSIDKLYLLSTAEVWSGGVRYDSATGTTVTRQLDYYELNKVTTSSFSKAIKQNNGSNAKWWLRSLLSNTSGSFDFHEVSSSGSHTGDYADKSSGVSPAFRLSN